MQEWEHDELTQRLTDHYISESGMILLVLLPLAASGCYVHMLVNCLENEDKGSKNCQLSSRKGRWTPGPRLPSNHGHYRIMPSLSERDMSIRPQKKDMRTESKNCFIDASKSSPPAESWSMWNRCANLNTERIHPLTADILLRQTNTHRP
jgi:hypothetical protein